MGQGGRGQNEVLGKKRRVEKGMKSQQEKWKIEKQDIRNGDEKPEREREEGRGEGTRRKEAHTDEAELYLDVSGYYSYRFRRFLFKTRPTMKLPSTKAAEGLKALVCTSVVSCTIPLCLKTQLLSLLPQKKQSIWAASGLTV